MPAIVPFTTKRKHDHIRVIKFLETEVKQEAQVNYLRITMRTSKPMLESHKNLENSMQDIHYNRRVNNGAVN